MIRVTLLGTVAARSTPNRNVSSLVIQREDLMIEVPFLREAAIRNGSRAPQEP